MIDLWTLLVLAGPWALLAYVAESLAGIALQARRVRP